MVINELVGAEDQPLLVVGPSLGVGVKALWDNTARELSDQWHVVGWELPGYDGHRGSPEVVTVEELAAAVLSAVTGPFANAGDSVGGCVGLQLLLDAADRVASATLLCTGALIGTPEGWRERAHVASRDGMRAMVDGSRERWFGRGFVDRNPGIVNSLLSDLTRVDPVGYAAVCHGLARFDVRGRLGGITTPVLSVAGADDVPTPPSCARQIAEGVANGRLVVLAGVGHLAPIEAPRAVARLIRDHSAGSSMPSG